MLGLAETWLDDTVADGELAIPHFKLFRRDRDRHGGGVAFYCHESLQICHRRDLETDALEMIWLEVQGSGSKSLLSCAYRPPSQTADYWITFSNSVERAMEGRQSSTTILGDLNVNLLDGTNHNTSHLQRILNNLGLINFVNTSHSSNIYISQAH